VSGSGHSQDELLAIVNEIFVEGGPFTKDLGIRIESVEGGNVRIGFEMRDGFVGLSSNPMLHGGVVASVLDVAGGIVVFLGAIRKMKLSSIRDRSESLKKLNTIDIRIDYLRSGIGKYFTATGYILRTGNKVAVARMELYNEEQYLITVGTGSYMYAVK